MFKNLISFKTLLWTTSVILAVCSAAFSVFGLSKLFAGASLSVIVMASTLEFAKLITVTFLHNYYAEIKSGMRIYFLSASAILMIITSLGVYGFLTNAYQLTLKTYSENQINTQFIEKNKELLSKEILYLEKQQEDLTKRLQSYDKIRIDQETALISNSSKNNVQRNIKSTSKITDDINNKLDVISEKKNKLNDSLSVLEKQTLSIELENTQTELGPLIYISRITGYSMDYIVNIFVLIITLVFDPLAIALLLAANILNKIQNKNNSNEIKSEETVPRESDLIEENSSNDTVKIDLENQEKNAILDLEKVHPNYNDIPDNGDISDNMDYTDTVIDNSIEDEEKNLSDEDKFYETEVENSKFNKHPWKVGF